MRRSAASNLSETELLVGEIAAATATAEKAVALADRAGDASADDGQPRRPMPTRSTPLASGKRRETLFADAERRQQKQQPKYPLLYSLRGYRYCDLLLSQGQAADGARSGGANFRNGAAARLGSRHRARHSDTRPRPSRPGVAEPGERAFGRDRARRCARRRRQARRGRRRPARLGPKRLCPSRSARPRRLPPRRRRLGRRGARSRRGGGDRRAGADAALSLRRARSSARGSLWREREAFAPLNGLVEPSPPPPALPDAAAAARAQ